MSLSKTLIKKGVELIPATDEQIQTLMINHKLDYLPLAYIEFLKSMGNGTSDFLRGESCFFDELFHLQEWGKEILEEDNSLIKLKESHFIFWMSQGIMFALFDLTEGDNPPIYFYKEMSKQTSFKKIADSLTEFLSRYEEGDQFLFKI